MRYLIILWSVLVALGISLHIFVVMMETGATQAGMEKKRVFALSGVFLAVQIGVQILGIALTWWIKRYLQIDLVERLYKFAYVVLLIGISYHLVLKLRQSDYPEEKKNSPVSIKQCAILSFRTSAEALLLGMTMYYYDSLTACLFIVILGFFSAVGGFFFGYLNGVRSEKTLCAIDGVLLFFLVCKALFI